MTKKHIRTALGLKSQYPAGENVIHNIPDNFEAQWNMRGGWEQAAGSGARRRVQLPYEFRVPSPVQVLQGQYRHSYSWEAIEIDLRLRQFTNLQQTRAQAQISLKTTVVRQSSRAAFVT